MTVGFVQRADAHEPAWGEAAASILTPHIGAAFRAKKSGVTGSGEMAIGGVAGEGLDLALLDQCVHHEGAAGYALALTAVAGMHNQRIGVDSVAQFAARASALIGVVSGHGISSST